MNTRHPRVTSPSDKSLTMLCEQLRTRTDGLDREDAWPAESLEYCAQHGVFEWFAARDWGGQDWKESDLVKGYVALSGGCLTTAFILTQRTAACQRIERSGNASLKEKYMPGLVHGDIFATVGISHLTTSRRHLQRPVLRAVPNEDGFLLDGYCPWVTGAPAADIVVIGATLEHGEQILAVLPTSLPGVEIARPAHLVGLSSSQTAAVHCHQVQLGQEWLLAGPSPDVMKQGVGARTGGLQTSALALGLAASVLAYLEGESVRRPDLTPVTKGLRTDWTELYDALVGSAEHQPVCTDAELRARANSFVLRASQAALVTAKGAGYIQGHPAGRWCRESLFFLVWSCPQPVLEANLCEFAGIELE